MELELGLKITHTRDDITSFTDLRIAKDHAGPFFLSRETETMFTLVAYLKGFRKENIDIKINEDGNRITICGKKPVQEMELIGWIMHKKQVELRAFRRVFRIPDGVILNKIRAKFNEEDSALTITIPKLVKGIHGVGIEEVKEEEVDKGRGEAAPAVADKAPEIEYRQPGMKKREEIDKAFEFPRKEKDNEAAKEESIEPKIITNEETAQVKAKVIDQEQFKAAGGEKSEESNIKSKEETENFVEQKVDAGELVPQRVVDTTLQKKTEPEDRSKLEEATPGKPKYSPTAAAYQETAVREPKEVKPEKEIEHQETKEPTPAEETESEEPPGLKQQGKKQETPEPRSRDEETFSKHLECNELTQAVKDKDTKPPEASNQPLSAQANQEHTTEANHPVRDEISRESEKLETERNVQEPTIPVPDQEKKLPQTPRPADKSRNDDAREIKEEATDGVVEEPELLDGQKQKDLTEGATNRNNPVSRRTKLCPPLVVAGSAILVSIIVLVISWIRAKKR